MFSTKTRILAVFFFLLAVALGGFLFFVPERTVNLSITTRDPALYAALATDEILNPEPSAGESPLPRRTAPDDIEPQSRLGYVPDEIKAIYATSWSMGHQGKTNYLVGLADSTEINAMVIDIKDYTGIISYLPDEAPLVSEYDAWEPRIPKVNQLIKDLHDRGIYVIGRLSVFQDVALAKARPDLALVSSSTGKTWTDHKGLMWMDSSSKEVWDYNIAIAKDALNRGFDEINFDYIRFASDGKLSDIKYPHWDETTLKTHIMRDFFKYVREQLGPDAQISADLFGLTTINRDGLGIGQHLEFALPYFDAIAPMVYPSHYFPGFIGLKEPAEHPYEVIKYSMDTAVDRLKAFRAKNGTSTPMATLRPWFQDFDLGADYDREKVRAQIQAWYDSASTTPEFSSGWMIWNASNRYTDDAFHAES